MMPQGDGMKYLARTLALAALTIALSGCATPRLAENQTRLVIHSNPAGAIIRFKGKGGGVESRPSPIPIVWTLDKGTYISDALVSATWPSGATTTTRLNLYAGQDSTVLMQRPDVPGLDRDQQFAKASETAAADASANRVVLLLNAATVAMDVHSKAKRAQASKYATPATQSESTDSISASTIQRQNLGKARGYQTRDAYGNLVNSRDNYIAKDSHGNLVSSKDNYQTRDSLGNIVSSRDNYQTTDSSGNIVQSGD